MNKLKKISAAFALVFILSCVTSFLSISVSAEVPATEARDSVVTVVRSDGKAQGSGFAIGEVGKPIEYIVTNNHIVRGEWNNTTATVYFSIAADKKMLANVYFYDKERDIAVLKLPEPTTERKALVLCPMKYVNLDDSFAALGYPGNQETDWPKYSVDDITVTKGGIKKTDRVNGLDVYMLDLTVTHGNSGGPLINSDGEVVGITTFGLGDDNYAVAIDELLSAIDTDKIPVTVHKSKLWLYAIIGGGVLLVLAVLLVILLTKKKSDDGDISSSNKSEERNVQPQPKHQARVVAIGGILNGRRYNITGSVRMGRDSSKCQIAFPVNTQGVSGVHCEISFNGSVFYIKDLGSSYGTFTSDGKKLAPNAPTILKSGERFYLASTANMFEVNF